MSCHVEQSCRRSKVSHKNYRLTAIKSGLDRSANLYIGHDKSASNSLPMNETAKREGEIPESDAARYGEDSCVILARLFQTCLARLHYIAKLIN